MGPDSSPRTVLGLIRGHGRMFRIVPIKGEPFTVNEDHVLTLARTNDGSPYAGTTVDISVREYLATDRTFKHVHKLFRVGVEFPRSEDRLPLTPYFMGILLGDGGLTSAVSVVKPDPEIAVEMETQAAAFGLSVRTETSKGTRCPAHFITNGCRGKANPLIDELRALGLFGCDSSEKFIPQQYKTASVGDRLTLLAGLMDTDGHYSKCGYDFISKSEALACDVAFVARSVGFAAYVRPCHKYAQTGNGGLYYRVHISGDVALIPCRIPRKKAAQRQQIKSHLRTGFSVEPAGEDDFYGFTLDGDGRYLLDDFTVTHNSGKTTIAADLIHSAVSKGARVHMVAHRKELIEQASRRLDSVGVDHGIIKASHPRRRPWLPVQVCSIQTIVRREKLLPADIIIVDEAHRAVAESYRKVIDRYPNAIVLGLTATPVRSTGEGLGKPGGLFDCLVECPSIGELTDMGYLVRTRIYAPNKPDLRGVHTQAGDYKPDELARAVDKPKLTGDIVDHWKRLGQNRQTICFAVSVEHSKHIASEFMRAGIPAMHLDAETPDDQRDEILRMLESGQVRVLCNVGILTEGWDMPVVSCCILARPTQSLGLYLQCVGRVLRPVTEQDWLDLCRKHPYYGMQVRKTDALILDHSGCVMLHGFPDEEREWSLDGTWTRKAKKGAAEVATPVVCKKCLMCFPSTEERCPSCGWVKPKQKREVKHEDGELQEITRGARTAEKWRELPETARVAHYRKMLAEQQAKGYKPNYAAVQFHRIYGVWPKKEWKQQPVGVAV